jgi:hypothetical protein
MDSEFLPITSGIPTLPRYRCIHTDLRCRQQWVRHEQDSTGPCSNSRRHDVGMGPVT